MRYGNIQRLVNSHYGYVGRELFGLSTLFKAAGLVQIISRTSSIYYYKTNFDDPRDQWAIKLGYRIWDWESVL